MQLVDAVTARVQLPAIFVGTLGGVGAVGVVGEPFEPFELPCVRVPVVSQAARTSSPNTRACLKLIAPVPTPLQNNARANVRASAAVDVAQPI